MQGIWQTIKHPLDSSGVSNSKMNQLCNDLDHSGIDRSFVCRCLAQIDAEVEVWKNRELGTRYAYIWLEAIYTNVLDRRRASARGDEVALKIVLDAETKMKDNAIERLT